jgi:predicted Rossmann-fold nucleotide-binding protein
MHERKARIHELSDAILVLPGGYGTLDELLEAITWAQIGLHAKPCILINTANYWDGLLAFLDTAVAAGFIEARNRTSARGRECAASAANGHRQPPIFLFRATASRPHPGATDGKRLF